MGPYAPLPSMSLLWHPRRAAVSPVNPGNRHSTQQVSQAQCQFPRCTRETAEGRPAPPSLPTLRRVSSTQTAGRDRSPVWLDEGEVNPQWAPPAGDPVRPSRVRRGLVYGGTLLSLGLVVGLLYLAGGFEKRTDLLEQVPPGALIVSGSYEFRFTEATAQPETDTDGKPEGWEVVVVGQDRTPGDETMAP